MILLYNPRVVGTKQPLPIAVLSLAAVFESRYRWQMVDGNFDADAGNTILQTLEANPDIRYLMVSVMPGYQLMRALPHTRAVKERFPHVTTIWGGYFPSNHADVVMTDPAVDYVVRSQGELTILELLDSLENGRPLDGILGLTYRENGTVRNNPNRPIMDVNKFPVLPYEKVDMPRYLHRTILGKRTVGYHSSQGCPFPCSFCAVPKTYAGRWLAETPERTINTVLWLKERYGVDSVEYYDSNYFTYQKRVAAVAEGLKGKGINWWTSGTIDTLMRYDDHTWDLMRDSGCRMIFMGAESGSATTLKSMDKPLKPETTLEIAKKTKAWGIIPEFSFVLGNPPDPEADIRENIEFIRTIKKINPASEIILYLYTPTPGGSMYEKAVAGGFRYPETLDEWANDEWVAFSLRHLPHTPWLRREHITLLDDFRTVLSARYPTVSDLKIQTWHRWMLKTLSSWRYQLGIYSSPIELRAMLKFISYRQIELEGL